MQNANQGHAAALNGTGLHIGIVQARFNEDITNTLAQACKAELAALGVGAENIHHVFVPGALEVPLALQALADMGQFDALVALGCIIRGETYHFELVANESGAGVSRVALDYHIPIANAIITTEDMPQAGCRQRLARLHLEAAQPLGAVPAQRDVSELALYLLALAQPDPAELGQLDSAVGLVQHKLFGVWIPDARVVAMAFERRESSSLGEKALIGHFETF